MTDERLDEAALALLGGAFASGYESESASRLVTGLCFSPEMDLAVALGWPHLCRLGLPSGEPDAPAAVMQRLAVHRPPPVPWPRDLASRAARFLACGYDAFPSEPTPEALEAVQRDDAIGPDDVPELLQTLCELPVAAWEHPIELLWLLEALGSTRRTVDALLDRLESGDEPWAFVQPIASAMAKRITHLIGRLRPSEVAECRARAGAILEAGVRAEPRLLEDPALRLVPLRALDLLSGRTGVERSAYRVEERIDPNDAIFVDRESFLSIVRGLGKPRPGELPTAQWVVAGGDEVLDIELERWVGYGVQADVASAHRFVVQQYGVFRRPGAVLLIADMAARSQAREDATQWLVEHQAYALPVLEEAASGSGRRAEIAQTALRSR